MRTKSLIEDLYLRIAVGLRGGLLEIGLSRITTKRKDWMNQ